MKEKKNTHTFNLKNIYLILNVEQFYARQKKEESILIRSEAVWRNEISVWENENKNITDKLNIYEITRMK